jgi:hypothetical protein
MRCGPGGHQRRNPVANATIVKVRPDCCPVSAVNVNGPAWERVVYFWPCPPLRIAGSSRKFFRGRHEARCGNVGRTYSGSRHQHAGVLSMWKSLSENGPVQRTEVSSSEPKGQELSFAARVLLDRTQMQVEDKLVNLSPGMAVTVEIKTGSIISYLLSPILRYKQGSLRER